jgi:Kdo2-lipid IVA lauroyltransferase/acyltransferase
MKAPQPEGINSSGLRQTAIWWSQAALFRGGTWLLAQLPSLLVHPFGGALGRLCFLLLASRRRVALAGIRDSLPSLPAGSNPRRIAIACFVNLATSFIENCKLYHGADRMLHQVKIEGLEHYRSAREKGKGIVFITGHCGNWELIALTFGFRHDPFVVMVREQKNPYLTRCIESMRTRYGNSIIYKKTAIREMMKLFKKNGVTGMLIDQAVMPSEGYLIDFLGRPAWTTSMPVLMARRCGVALLPAFIIREGKGHRIIIHPQVEFPSDDNSDAALARDTAALTRHVDDFVRSYPEQWYWVHRRWKSRQGDSGTAERSKG